MRFFTSFGAGHFNNKVQIDGLNWTEIPEGAEDIRLCYISTGWCRKRCCFLKPQDYHQNSLLIILLTKKLRINLTCEKILTYLCKTRFNLVEHR